MAVAMVVMDVPSYKGIDIVKCDVESNDDHPLEILLLGSVNGGEKRLEPRRFH
jgi:hypothetical protein